METYVRWSSILLFIDAKLRPSIFVVISTQWGLIFQDINFWYRMIREIIFLWKRQEIGIFDKQSYHLDRKVS